MNNFSVEELRDVVAIVEESLGAEYEVKFIENMIKDGKEVSAISIVDPEMSENGNTVAITLYFNDEMLKGVDYVEDLVARVLRAFENRAKTGEPSIFVKMLDSFESSKGLIVPVVLSTGKYDKDRLSKRIEGTDMSIYYKVMGPNNMSTAITESLAERWGVAFDTIHSVAMENLNNNSDSYEIQGISKVLMGMLSEEEAAMMGLPVVPDEDEQLFVVSNTEKLFGANAMLLKGIMNKAKEKLGVFFILPSSIHELLLVRKAGSDVSALGGIVGDVNATQVSDADFLAEGVYEYDFAKEMIVPAR